MLMKEMYGLDVVILKQYELILAFHAVYLLKHPEYKEKLDFIEIPNIFYMQELVDLIDTEKYPEIIKYILNFEDCAIPVHIAVGMNENYEIDNAKFETNCLSLKYIKYGTVYGFAKEIQKLAEDIKWDEFFLNHYKFYKDYVNIACNYPADLDLNDIINFYHVPKKHYIYSPSMLMNGGFGLSDKQNNSYYFRGINYNEKSQKFEYNNEYLLECMFHEFSHPITNPLVTKYLKDTDILNEFYEMSKRNNLVSVYSGNNLTVMCEYLVRANAHILASKYYKDIEPKEDSWIVKNGFKYLPELIELTKKNLPKYPNYEEFFKKEIYNFMTIYIEKDKKELENKKNKR